MQSKSLPTHSTDILLAPYETSEQQPPDGWTRVSCGSVVYYHHAAQRLTTDIEPLCGGTQNTLSLSVPANVDIHLPGPSLHSDKAILINHDKRVACKPRPWPEWAAEPTRPVPASNGVRSALQTLLLALLHAPFKLRNRPTTPASNINQMPPPADAEVTSIHMGNEDEETALDQQIRYWDYIRQHPGHVDVASFAHTVRDHLLWSRNDRALSLGADPAFSHDECEMFLRYLDPPLPPPDVPGGTFLQASAKARQTRLIAALMKRILKSERERQPRVQDVTNARSKPAEAWLRWILYLVLIQMIFLGQPNTYSRRLARFKHGKPLSLDIHTKYWQAFLGAFVKEWNDTNLLATVMISATVGFLAVTGLDSISRILGITAIIAAIGSGLVGMVYVWHHGPRANTDALVGRTYIANGKNVFGMKSSLLFACVLAVPVVLLWWSFLSFIAAVLVYAFRGQFPADPGANATWDFSAATKYVALVAFVVVLFWGAVGYVFMWKVWQPISEPWAGTTRSNESEPPDPDP